MEQLIKPGSTVFVAGNLDVKILQVRIGLNDNVEYLVGYWDSNRWTEAVIPEIVLSVKSVGTLDIGNLWQEGK